MERRVVTLMTFFVMAAAVLGTMVLGGLRTLHPFALRFESVSDVAMDTGMSVLSLLRDNSQMFDVAQQENILKNHQLRLELPADVTASSVEYTQDYMSRTIRIMIPGIGSSYFYDFPMVGSSDHILDVFFDPQGDNGCIELRLDGVYELSTIADERYIYLDFPTPRDRYDYVVVIDAGHGGNDVGAYKEEIAEKEINLDILLKMKEIFEEDGENIGVYYTRTDDSNPSLQSRAALANEIGADLFLSIHNNSTSSGRMSGIHGTEVMYLVADPTEASKAFAQRVLDHLLDELGSDSKGLIAGDDIYIVRMARMPVALAEIGFMTNAEELGLLSDEDYQKKAARAMVDAIYEELGITEE